MRKNWIAGLAMAVLLPVGLLAAGTTQNEVSYNAKNESVNGTYKIPAHPDGAKFLGWSTTKEKAERGAVDFAADPEDVTNQSLGEIGGGVRRPFTPRGLAQDTQ